MLAGIVTVRFLNLVKFFLKSTVLTGIVTSKLFETSQVLAEEHCAGRDCDK